MPLKVLGAGLGRTGTLSLKVAFEQLGFAKCYHMTEVFAKPEHVGLWHAAARGEPVNWEALFRGYQATVDCPGCNFYHDVYKLLSSGRCGPSGPAVRPSDRTTSKGHGTLVTWECHRGRVSPAAVPYPSTISA
jgi:hypothetical protein